MAEAVEVTMKNGRKAVKGKCPVCGTVMFKMLGGKGGSTPEPETPPTNA
jgi:ribosomal protein S27E